jgi:hypothetical protein
MSLAIFSLSPCLILSKSLHKSVINQVQEIIHKQMKIDIKKKTIYSKLTSSGGDLVAFDISEKFPFKQKNVYRVLSTDDTLPMMSSIHETDWQKKFQSVHSQTISTSEDFFQLIQEECMYFICIMSSSEIENQTIFHKLSTGKHFMITIDVETKTSTEYPPILSKCLNPTQICSLGNLHVVN